MAYKRENNSYFLLYTSFLPILKFIREKELILPFDISSLSIVHFNDHDLASIESYLNT